MERYDPAAIEARWQKIWQDQRIHEVPNPEPGDDTSKLMYVLEMLPYPSGELHMGHVKNYTMGDVVTLYKRRNGYRVMHPMGYDAFGLPAENAAIKSGKHPSVSTRENIEAIRVQMRRMGWSIDWTRELSTSEPDYYRWTQWIFLRLFEAGLAYRKNAAVKWCPNDQTVLANEQVIDGHCERCGAEVEAKNLEQWFFKITDYAQRLLDDLADVRWPERVVTMQRNWIGRSEGAEVTFRVEHDPSIELPVFTTRPDTLYGATFFVLAPEHPLSAELARGADQLGCIHRHAGAGGQARHHRVAGGRGIGARTRGLPPARLAAVAAALLGLSDSDRALRVLRRRARAGRPAAGGAAPGRGLRPQGPLPAGRRRGLGAGVVPELRRPGPARDRHDGHVRGLVLVLHALRGSPELDRAVPARHRRHLAAGRPVHRRRRARDPAPDVRVLFHQGVVRPGAPGLHRAVREPVHAGDDPLPRRQDVQVAGQHHQSR